ncbi:MAG: hypothetical protein AAF755_07820 [Pseudomonadota bacterium]
MKLHRNFVSALLICLGSAVAADETDKTETLRVELNAADTIGDACRLTFLINNDLAVDVESLVVETVLFSKEQQVILLTLFDFAALPLGRPRVRQFQVPNVTCDGIGMVLVNGADNCAGNGLNAAVCERSLVVSSRTSIALEG